ncbi:hypothetical protein GCM10020331_063350 [Ectobacillus funiculus]
MKRWKPLLCIRKITNSTIPFEIQGEEGNIRIDKVNTPEQVEIYYRNGTVENITQPQKKVIRCFMRQRSLLN